MSETIAAIRGLLSEKLLVEVDSPEADLLKAGILDSLALVQLLLHLEERFGVKIPLDELEIEDLRSISSIARLVENQRSAGETARPRNTAVRPAVRVDRQEL